MATPVFLVDEAGTLVYFNESAERVLGQSYVEGRVVALEEWSTAFAPVSEAGEPVDLDGLPLGIALTDHRPAHRALRIVGADEVVREIEVTAFPLFARPDQLVGAIAIFWERPEGA